MSGICNGYCPFFLPIATYSTFGCMRPLTPASFRKAAVTFIIISIYCVRVVDGSGALVLVSKGCDEGPSNKK